MCFVILCLLHIYSVSTGRFIMFSVITNIYNKKSKGPTLMELFTATGKQARIGTDNCSSEEYWCTHCWRVCSKNLNIASMCAVSPVVHTSNVSSCQKKLFQFYCGCEQFHQCRSFGFLTINICNQGEHYETPCISVLIVKYIVKSRILAYECGCFPAFCFKTFGVSCKANHTLVTRQLLLFNQIGPVAVLD
jgi:hypothetical protein